MFGKKWGEMWAGFDVMMAALPGAVEEAVEGGVDGAVVTQVSNGNIVLRGKFKSLKINGRTIRVPKEVLEG